MSQHWETWKAILFARVLSLRGSVRFLRGHTEGVGVIALTQCRTIWACSQSLRLSGWAQRYFAGAVEKDPSAAMCLVLDGSWQSLVFGCQMDPCIPHTLAQLRPRLFSPFFSTKEKRFGWKKTTAEFYGATSFAKLILQFKGRSARRCCFGCVVDTLLMQVWIGRYICHTNISLLSGKSW